MLGSYLLNIIFEPTRIFYRKHGQHNFSDVLTTTRTDLQLSSLPSSFARI